MFKIGDHITWLDRHGHTINGTIVEVVPPNTTPMSLGWHWDKKSKPYTVKFNVEMPFTRKDETYLCRVETNGKPHLWWPRGTALQLHNEGLFNATDQKL